MAEGSGRERETKLTTRSLNHQWRAQLFTRLSPGSPKMGESPGERMPHWSQHLILLATGKRALMPASVRYI